MIENNESVLKEVIPSTQPGWREYKTHNLTATEAILETQKKKAPLTLAERQPFLFQSEMIDAIVEKVCDRVMPALLRLEEAQRRGVLVGAPEINEYMNQRSMFAVKLPMRKVFIRSDKIKRWHDKWGFPITKNYYGTWYTTKSLIDSWIVSMDLLSRKLESLGYRIAHGKGKDGYVSYAFPFRFKEEEIAHAQLELKKDKARGLLSE